MKRKRAQNGEDSVKKEAENLIVETNASLTLGRESNIQRSSGAVFYIGYAIGTLENYFCAVDSVKSNAACTRFIKPLCREVCIGACLVQFIHVNSTFKQG